MIEKEAEMTKAEKTHMKKRLLARSKARLEALWSAPGFVERHAEWKREYDATTAMHRARQEAKLSQAEVARRMNVPRASVYRIEHGQNVTIATLTRYLRACGFGFTFTFFPLDESAAMT